MNWKDGLTAAAIVGLGLFGVKTYRDRKYRNYLVNKFGSDAEFDMGKSRKFECGECHAKGVINGKECPTCDGAGYWMNPAPICGSCNVSITGVDGAECDSCDDWACDACLGDDFSCPKCGDTDLSFHSDSISGGGMQGIRETGSCPNCGEFVAWKGEKNFETGESYDYEPPCPKCGGKSVWCEAENKQVCMNCKFSSGYPHDDWPNMGEDQLIYIPPAELGFKCKFCGSSAEGLDTWDDDYCSRACEKGLTVCGISDGKGQNGSYGEFCDIQYMGKSDADDNKIIIHIGCPNCEFSEDGWGMSFNQEMKEGYRAESFNAKGWTERPVDVAMEYKWETIPADTKLTEHQEEDVDDAVMESVAKVAKTVPSEGDLLLDEPGWMVDSNGNNYQVKVEWEIIFGAESHDFSQKSAESFSADDDGLMCVICGEHFFGDECPYIGKHTQEEIDNAYNTVGSLYYAESFAADSISICGVCSVAGHRHCGQTTGCPCCEIRVKKESQRPTCGDCGELKSSTPQEYNQWTCWPCVDSAGGSYHGTECYCSQCMSYENYAESFSAENKTWEYREEIEELDGREHYYTFLKMARQAYTGMYIAAREAGATPNQAAAFCSSKWLRYMDDGDLIGNDMVKMWGKWFGLNDITDMVGEGYEISEIPRTELYENMEQIAKSGKEFNEKFYDAESHAYSYAYNEGHSDSRKTGEYRPSLSTGSQEAAFKRIMKQKKDE